MSLQRLVRQIDQDFQTGPLSPSSAGMALQEVREAYLADLIRGHQPLCHPSQEADQHVHRHQSGQVNMGGRRSPSKWVCCFWWCQDPLMEPIADPATRGGL